MKTPYARQIDAAQWAIGNPHFELRVSAVKNGTPEVTVLMLTDSNQSLHAPGHAFGPAIEIAGEVYRPGQPGMAFEGMEAVDTPNSRPELQLAYACGGLRVCHHLSPSAGRPAWRSWTTLTNASSATIEGITRFDALSLRTGMSQAEPQAAYLLGWLDGPRADAPGGHAIPYPYPSWIPRLLYGDGAPNPPPPPPGGWSSPVLRLMKERLTKLPLRSGKRSTYDNYPWVTVFDPGREIGFFARF